MRIISAFVGMVAFIAVVAIAFWALSVDEREPMRELEAPAEAVPVGAKSAESAEVSKLSKRVKQLEEDLAEARAGAVVTADEPAKAKGKGKKGEGMMKTFAKMMEDPSMKDMLRQQQGIALKGMFLDFFREMGLSEDEEGAVLELLIDKQMVNTDLGMKMMGGELSEEEKQAITKEITENASGIDEEIKAVLGDEKFASYELFVDSMQERQQLNTFKEGLKGKGLELSVEAEEQLMDAMYSTRKDFKFSTDFGSDINPKPDALFNFNEGSLNQMMAEMRQLQAEVAAKASKILPPEQLETFKASQESQLKMQEMGMKMGLQMSE